MKVVGCKVSDEIYEKFIELDRPTSDSLREAISMYLEKFGTPTITRVNHSETMVNQNKNKHTYQTPNNAPGVGGDPCLQSETYEKEDLQHSDNIHRSYDGFLIKKKTFGQPYPSQRLSPRYGRRSDLEENSQRYFPNGKIYDTPPTRYTSIRCKQCGRTASVNQSNSRTGFITCPFCKTVLRL